MDMSDHPTGNRSARARGIGRAEMQRLLATLASGQSGSPTACAMRTGNVAGAGAESPAERMVRMFRRDKTASRASETGPFNGPVARKLAGKEDEEDVYRGT